jgi:hypothetical protein
MRVALARLDDLVAEASEIIVTPEEDARWPE